QMQELKDAAENVKQNVLQAQQEYPDLNLAERKALKKKIDSWQDYLRELELMSIYVTSQAITFRELPLGARGEVTDEDLEEGKKTAEEAREHLLSLQKNLNNDNFDQAFDDFSDWKKKHSEAYEKLLAVQETALKNTENLYATETGLDSVRYQKISYQDWDGNWISIYATKEFVEEWGSDGRSFYLVTESIGEVREEVEEVRENGLEKELTISIIEVSDNSYSDPEQTSPTVLGELSSRRNVDSGSNDRTIIEKKTCLPWEDLSYKSEQCGRQGNSDTLTSSSPEIVYSRLILNLEEQDYYNYAQLFSRTGLKNDVVEGGNDHGFPFFRFDKPNLENCYNQKILGEKGNRRNSCIEKTRSNQFIENLIKLQQGVFYADIVRKVDGTELWPSLRRNVNLPTKTFILGNGEEISFICLRDSDKNDYWMILDTKDNYE
ncbi:MAG: hypothetical protein KJ896_01460, partial [Nanoarchaeota archaeon]|nr:hypothetical protein [Nanoarchaeota archaeon]